MYTLTLVSGGGVECLRLCVLLSVGWECEHPFLFIRGPVAFLTLALMSGHGACFFCVYEVCTFSLVLCFVSFRSREGMDADRLYGV